MREREKEIRRERNIKRRERDNYVQIKETRKMTKVFKNLKEIDRQIRVRILYLDSN